MLLGQEETFSASSELLSRLCGVDLSDKQVENLCHHYGELLEEEVIDNELVVGNKSDELHYAMVDGSYILSRESGWTETKVGRIFKSSDNFSISSKRRMIHRSDYVAHIGNHKDFTAKMSPYLDRLNNVVFIADGASWIWKWVEDCYPSAVEILDFYHAFEKIGQWGSLFFKDTAKLQVWCERCKELLLEDKVGEVISEVSNMVCSGDVLTKRASLLTYLSHNQGRMRYKTYLERGYLIGSGAIESAQRTVVQHRCKRSGQRWTLKGGQQILNLRTIKLSNKWRNVVNLVRMAA